MRERFTINSGLLFYYMDNKVVDQMLKIGVTPSVTRVKLASKNERRMLTQQPQQTALQKADFSPEKLRINLPLMDKSSDFPLIFTKHRRNQYSGYKQINLNKSKGIKFQQENKEISRYTTPRKYQINIKNIAKLRKRYSLQPIHTKDHKKAYQKVFMATSKFLPKEDLQLEDLGSQRKYHQQLREIIRQMSVRKHSSSQKFLQNQQKIAQNSERSTNNQSYVKTEAAEKEMQIILEAQIGREMSEDISVRSKRLMSSNKPYYLQIKKRLENSGQQSMKKKDLMIKVSQRFQEETDLCGWSTQSFYKKNKSFFQQSPFNKLKLLKGQI